MNLLRYLHTIRYLRPAQVYGRLWHRVYRPRPDVRPAPECRPLAGHWQRGVHREPTMVAPGAFRFLNITDSVRSAADWNDPARSRLWRYNLHYFDDLNATDAAARSDWHRELLSRWILENPPGTGSGWEPYPSSLRIVNWVKWALGRELPLESHVRDSLAIQTRLLRKRLEFHLLGNHFWANAKALVFSGAFFVGDEAAIWLRTGLGILAHELDEQILADGGHFERSPMYHAIVLEDVLDLINLSRLAGECFPRAFVERLQRTAVKMLQWLRVMTHPDGWIAQFNDAALETRPEYSTLVEYARRLGLRVEVDEVRAMEVLLDSGYVRLENMRAVVLCDVGAVAPDYLPGHAHAETLTFELSLDGQRFLVNSGISTYDVCEERLRQRGTAAHNTVVVDDEDSSEVWGSFRVARRAKVFGVRHGEEDAHPWLEGAHDGYRRLPGSVIHHRRWLLSPNELIIDDKLDGKCQSAYASLHLHPSVTIRSADPSNTFLMLELDGRPLAELTFDAAVNVVTRHATWSPEFGRSLDGVVIVATLRKQLSTRLRWG